jgi:hypothetical protein
MQKEKFLSVAKLGALWHLTLVICDLIGFCFLSFGN